MRNHVLKTATIAAALLITAGAISANAVTVSVGGGGGNVAGVSSGPAAGTNSGVSVGTTSGPLLNSTTSGTDNKARVNLGGTDSSGTVAKATTGNVNGTDTTAVIGNGNGPLADANADGTTNDAAVNLGGIMGADLVGLLGGLNGGTGAINANRVGVAFAGLSDDGQSAVRLQCKGVMANPQGFSARQLKLCKVIQRIN